MFNIKIGGITYKISMLFPAVLVVLLYIDPSGLILMSVLAAVLHECGHCTALLMFREKPQYIAVSFYGMRMQLSAYSTLTYRQAAFVAAAGPMVNLLCAVLSLWIGTSDYAAVLHIGMALINLLPVIPLDGGQLVYWLLCLVTSEIHADRISSIISRLFLILQLMLALILACSPSHNLSLLAVSIYVILCRHFCK